MKDIFNSLKVSALTISILLFHQMVFGAGLIDVETAKKAAMYFCAQKSMAVEVFDIKLLKDPVTKEPYCYQIVLKYKDKPFTYQSIDELYVSIKNQCFAEKELLSKLQEFNRTKLFAGYDSTYKLYRSCLKMINNPENFITVTIGATDEMPWFISKFAGLPAYITESFSINNYVTSLTSDASTSAVDLVFLGLLNTGFLYKSGDKEIIIDQQFNVINSSALQARIKSKEEEENVKQEKENNRLKWIKLKSNPLFKNIGSKSQLDYQGTGTIIDQGYIDGVPYYQQDLFGVFTCGPVAMAQALGYWDDFYPNLVDYGSKLYDENPTGVSEMIDDLKTTMNWSASTGTNSFLIAPGTNQFCNNSSYNNNLSFSVDFDLFPSFSTVKNRINDYAPMIIFINGVFYEPNGYQNDWAHFMPIVGYYQMTNPDMDVIICHDGYLLDEDFEVNWDMPFWTVKWTYEVFPGGSDNVNPSCSITSPNNGGQFTGIMPIQATAADASGIWQLEFEYSLNHTTWIPFETVTGPQTTWMAYLNTYEVTNYDPTVWVRVRALDNWGNYSIFDECNQSFIIDNRIVQPTSIAVTENISPNPATSNAIINISGTAVYNTGSIVAQATVLITYGGNSWTAPLNNGNYSKNINAPSSSGNINVSVSDGILTGTNQKFLTITPGGSGSGYTFSGSTMCEDVEGFDPYDPIEETHWFRSTDLISYCWIHLTNLYYPIMARWQWTTPDGSTLPATYSDWTDDPTVYGYTYWDWWKLWSGYYINGSSLADNEGRYSVNISAKKWGGSYQYLGSQFYIISYDFKEHKMCKDVQSQPPYDPITLTNNYLQTDAKAVTWAKITDISEEMKVKVQWFEPNGSLYHENEYTVPDPGNGFYTTWYNQWFCININNNLAASKCGIWTVKYYEKDPTNVWDLIYDDQFKISESPNILPNGTVYCNPALPIEGQNISLNVGATDNTYLKKVELHWNDGTSHTQTWDNVLTPTFNQSFNIGNYIEGTVVEYYCKFFDTSGNQYETDHEQITIQDSDIQGPQISNLIITEYLGNNNGIIEEGEMVKVACNLTDPNGIGNVYFNIDNESVPVSISSNYYSIVGPYCGGSHNLVISAADNDLTPAYSTFYNSFTVAIPSIIINGSSSTCLEQGNYVYSTQAGMTGYEWGVSSGGMIISGGSSTDNTMTVKWVNSGSQSITVNYQNNHGCTNPSPTVFAVSVSPLPVPTISGPSSACINSNGIVYTTQTGMNNYQWSISGGTITGGNGTNSISVDWNSPGNNFTSVSYSNSNGCASTAPASLPVLIVSSVPSPAGPISGNTVYCGGYLNIGSAYFSVPTIPNATSYYWTIPPGIGILGGQGTNAITTSYPNISGIISVNGVNDCGTGAASNLSINFYPAPNPTITGPSNVCINSTSNTYFTETGMNGYNWIVSSGGSIIGGNSTSNTIVVGWQTEGAQQVTLKVSHSNGGCIWKITRSLNVNVNPTPPDVINLINQTVPNGNSVCTDAGQAITVAGNGSFYIVQNGGSSIVKAGQAIHFLPGLSVQSGGYLHAFISNQCPFCITPPSNLPMVVESDSTNNYTLHGTETPTIRGSIIRIYPNPTTGTFILESNTEYTPDKVFVDIYGMWGEKVLSKTLNGDRKHEFSLSNKPVGVYFIRVISGDNVETVKVIKH